MRLRAQGATREVGAAWVRAMAQAQDESNP